MRNVFYTEGMGYWRWYIYEDRFVSMPAYPEDVRHAMLLDAAANGPRTTLTGIGTRIETYSDGVDVAYLIRKETP